MPLLDTIRSHLRGTDDTHRVTPLELLFDLVFVYAITNVTGLMEHHVGGASVLEGLITLALVWFGWCAYTWLGNQARADEGLLRVAMVAAMAGMFFVAVSIPHAFEAEGNAALVLATGYAVVRITHLVVYLVAAGDDRELRSAVLGMLAVCGVMLVLLFIGASAGGDAQKWWWLAAVLADQVGVYAVRSTRWRVYSAGHFAERFGLVVIIAIGESVVAVGRSASTADLSARDAVALLCGLAIAVGLWWLYFDVVALVTERALHDASGVDRVRLGRDSYTYLHLPLVAGIVFTAMGLALLVAGEEHIDAGRYALYGGVATYLTGQVLFRWRSTGTVDAQRGVAAVLALAAIPVLRTASSLLQLAIPAILLSALVAFEVSRFRAVREATRHGHPT